MDKQAGQSGNTHMNGSKTADGTGPTAKDPVCGMIVNPATARHVAYAAKTYYFCSASCETKFQSAPDQYIGAISAPAGHERPAPRAPATVRSAGPNNSAAKGNTKYTCPMHPEIVRDAPGDCPICGMALVPIAGTGEDDGSELHSLARRLWIGVALSVPLVVLAMSPMIGIHEPFGLKPKPIG